MHMSTADNDITECAACGKGGDGLKACTACKLVKYCNATCQKEHRPMQKNECKKRAAELHDEALFKQPTPAFYLEDCPICMLPLPFEGETTYQPCCGQLICNGCVYAVNSEVDSTDQSLCPFCRAPAVISSEQRIKRINKRMEADDAQAIHTLGSYYQHGEEGLPQNYEKAFELWHRAGKLGTNLGTCIHNGHGAERNMKKAKHYYELAAMGGDISGRHYLGTFEAQKGKMNRAVKHWMIAAGAGHDESLEKIKSSFMIGCVTKDDFETALRASQR